MIQQEKNMKKCIEYKQTKKGTLLSAVLSISIVVLSLTVCDQFFTKGFEKSRNYRAENIDLTIHNLDRWLHRSIGNPPLARQLTIVILNKLDSPLLSARDKALFQRAGIKIAVESSNLGVTLLGNALGLLANAVYGTDEDHLLLKSILSGVQRDFASNGGQAAAQTIAWLVLRDMGDVDRFVNGYTPRFTEDSHFAATASASEVAQAVLMLSLFKLEKNNIEDVSEWDSFTLRALNVGLDLCSEGRTVVVDGNPAPEALVLAAYLNLIAENDRFEDNLLTSLIRGAFFSA